MRSCNLVDIVFFHALQKPFFPNVTVLNYGKRRPIRFSNGRTKKMMRL